MGGGTKDANASSHGAEAGLEIRAGYEPAELPSAPFRYVILKHELLYSMFSTTKIDISNTTYK